MLRIPKGYVENGVYIVKTAGDNNETIFRDPQDYSFYLKLLAKYKVQYGFKLFAFILLPSYLQLLIELKPGLSISNILHDIHSSYTKYFNAKYLRKGHVFQERHKIALAEKNAFLLQLTSFIHTAPEKEVLPLDKFSYLYGSLGFYMNPLSDAKGILDITNEITEVNSAAQAAGFSNYAEVLKRYPAAGLESFAQELKKQILGSESFVLAAASQAESAAMPRLTGNSRRFSNLYYVVSFFGAVVLLVLLIVQIRGSQARKTFLNVELRQKEYELSKQAAAERKAIKKDLEEKYQADMVSYEAMSKRLEIEKKKRQELENTTMQRKP